MDNDSLLRDLYLLVAKHIPLINLSSFKKIFESVLLTCHQISIHLLASVLISRLPLNTSATQQNPDLSSKAMIIDTTGSFPLSLLARVLKSRITMVQVLSARTANQTANYQLTDQSTDFYIAGQIDADVQRCLEMVAISRVFDVEGLWEVLGEVGRDTGKSHEGDVAVGSKRLSEGEEKHQDLYKTQEIIDSEEETSPSDEDASPASITRIEAETSRDHGTEIIIVDNLTHIINELFARKEKGDGKSLSHLHATMLTLAKHILFSRSSHRLSIHSPRAKISSRSSITPLSLQNQPTTPLPMQQHLSIHSKKIPRTNPTAHCRPQSTLQSPSSLPTQRNPLSDRYSPNSHPYTSSSPRCPRLAKTQISCTVKTRTRCRWS
jgi:hypothetical protein